jgi:drug/metabolite transporter (DMT)-like permease
MAEQKIFAAGSAPSPETGAEISAPNARQGLAFAALILGNVAIAFGPLMVRFADTGPIASGFWRLALALPFLAFFAYRAGFRLASVPSPILWLLLLSGVTFGIDIIAWHLGIIHTKVANATLFGNCASIILVFYGIYLARKLPGRMQMVAIFLAVAGGALLMGQSFELSPRNFLGDVLSLIGGLFYAFYLVFMIRVRATTESWGALTLASLVAALVMLPAAIMAGEQVIPVNWTPLIILALTSQVIGQGLLTYALSHFKPLLIGLALLLQPALSAVAGWVVFNETLTLFDIIGGVLVMAALVLVRLSDDAR